MVQSAQPASSPPFVIWTLQRTGGTNLTQRLIELGGLRGTEHEPFNEGRVHGEVTRRWRQQGDVEELAEAMTAVAASGAVIKHCVEMVPWQVSLALAEATSAAGYRHLFLYRRRALSRLLSLQFARVSGIWGPQMAAKADASSESLQRHLLPVPQLLAHEQHCVTALTRCWEKLLSLGQVPSALAFEDLYAAASPQMGHATLNQLLAELDLPRRWADMPTLLAQVLGKGEQGTRSKYEMFQGVQELERALLTQPGFVPAPPLLTCVVTQLAVLPTWVRWASVDALPSVMSCRQRLEGLVVLAADAPRHLRLVLRHQTQFSPLPWGFDSAWAKQKFPHSPNGATARFSAQLALQEGHASLVIEEPATGRRQVCLELAFQRPSLETVVASALALPPETDDVAFAQALWRELERAPRSARDGQWQAARRQVLKGGASDVAVNQPR